MTLDDDSVAFVNKTHLVKTEFSQWQMSARLRPLLVFIECALKELKIDVIQIQQARCSTLQGNAYDSLGEITKMLHALRYIVVARSYNEHIVNEGLHYITAFRSTMLLVDYLQLYITKTPFRATDHSLPLNMVMENNYGQIDERCVLVVKARRDSQTYYFINVDLAPDATHRLYGADIVRRYVETEAEYDPCAKFVVSGNFGLERGDPDSLRQMQYLTTMDTLTIGNRKSTDLWCDPTVYAFPFYFASDAKEMSNSKVMADFKSNREALIEQSDLVLHRGFDKCACHLITTRRELDDNCPLQTVVTRSNKQPAFWTQRQPILATLDNVVSSFLKSK